MNEILFYTTIDRIIQNDTTILILHLIQIFSALYVLIAILYNMVANGNLLDCGVFKRLSKSK